MILFLRSTLFNIIFFGVIALLCIACLPGLLLPGKKIYIIVKAFVKTVYFLERHIAGIDYEVRGRENLPKNGAFIVAAKHQSAYETMKLHLLFDEPAVVLKKELLDIPLWGRFLARSEPIAIDRKQGKQATAQIVEGAIRIAAQQRPIVIFPQGTRVRPEQTPADKPYKSGVARMAAATGMPVIPMALNSGVFWPRHSWIKRPGTVVFEFLPALATASPEVMMAELEEKLETASMALCRESLS